VANINRLERLAREAKSASAALEKATRRPDQAAIAAAYREAEAAATVFLEEATPDAWLELIEKLRAKKGI